MLSSKDVALMLISLSLLDTIIAIILTDEFVRRAGLFVVIAAKKNCSKILRACTNVRRFF